VRRGPDTIEENGHAGEEDAMTSPRARARIIERLVETLLPGDEDFPSGAEAGVSTKLVERLADTDGDGAVERVLKAVDALETVPPAEARSVVEAFERDEPTLFARVRAITFVSYYENPFVQEAIRDLGFLYNATPLPRGYGIRRFDMEKDVPQHSRGRYVPTDEVKRVDLSGLTIAELSHGR
jgi:hypothetical protein